MISKRFLTTLCAVVLVSAGVASRALASNVVVFFDPTYVQTGGTDGEEGSNMQGAAIAFGHTVTTITGITAADFTAGLAGQDVFIIPDLELNSLEPDLAQDAKDAIAAFVNNGGRMVIANSDNDSSASDLINGVFGFSTAIDATTDVTSDQTAAAANTLFAGQIAQLPANDATAALTGLPPEAVSVYDTALASSMVFILPVGQGEIIYLGYDWFESDPPNAGEQDGGWSALLATALADADLVITKTVLVDTVQVGDNVTFTVTVMNNGPNDAINVSVSDLLPLGLTLASATPSQGTCTGNASITCDLGALANGASATIDILAKADVEGTVANQATVTGAMIDPNTGNNSASATVTVQAPALGDLSGGGCSVAAGAAAFPGMAWAGFAALAGLGAWRRARSQK